MCIQCMLLCFRSDDGLKVLVRRETAKSLKIQPYFCCFKHKDGIRNACLDILVSFVLGMLLSCTAEYVFRYDSIVYKKRLTLIFLDILLLFRRTYFRVTATFYTVNIFNQSRLSILTKKKRKEKKCVHIIFYFFVTTKMNFRIAIKKNIYIYVYYKMMIVK